MSNTKGSRVKMIELDEKSAPDQVNVLDKAIQELNRRYPMNDCLPHMLFGHTAFVSSAIIQNLISFGEVAASAISAQYNGEPLTKDEAKETLGILNKILTETLHDIDRVFAQHTRPGLQFPNDFMREREKLRAVLIGAQDELMCETAVADGMGAEDAAAVIKAAQSK